MKRTLKTLIALMLCALITLAPMCETLAEGLDAPVETIAPTEEPVPTAEPTAEPTVEPTAVPTVEPTAEPTVEPTAEPTVEPTAEPTVEPTAEPTVEPTAEPTVEPTAEPTAEPTVEPTSEPTAEPTAEPDVKAAVEESIFIWYVSGKDARISGLTDESKAPSALVIPSAIEGHAIVGIDKSAFAGLTAITSVSVPGTVSDIAESAFAGCVNLSKLTVASGVKSIGDNAFAGCVRLQDFSLPYATLTYIGRNSFDGCPLSYVDYVYAIKDSEVVLVRCVDSEASVTIPNTVGGKKLTVIGESAFDGNSSVSSVAIGANVYKIEDKAFRGLSKLSALTWNSSVRVVGESAFESCSALKSVSFTDALLTIGSRAFANTGIAAVEIPANVNSIAPSAFDGCKISSFEVDASNATYSALDNMLFTSKDRCLIRCYGVETVVEVPSSVKIIGESAFADKTKLTEVTLPSTVTTISASAFSGCGSLATVVVPESVVSIADNAFYKCGKLTVKVYSSSCYAYSYCKKNSIPVTVVSGEVPPTGISLENITIGIGNTAQLPVAFVPANASADMMFSSSKKKIVAVDPSTGVITGKKLGKAVITVTTDNGLTAKCTVRVKNKPAKIALAASTSSLGVGQTFDLDPELNNGAGGTITFTSSNESVVKVDSKGIVTAVGVGAATVKVKTYNGKQAKCKFTVIKAPAKLTVSKAALTMGVNQKYMIGYELDNGQDYKALTFTSDNPRIASVGKKGRILARKTGFATITVKAYNSSANTEDLVATIDVVVRKAPASFTLSSTKANLYKGQTWQIDVKLPVGTAAGFTYKSNKTSIAAVNADGLITAKKAGTAKITVTSHNGKSKTLNVTVKKAASKVYLNPSKLTLGAGDSGALKVTFNSGAGASVTFESDDTNVATVDGSGNVNAVAEGSAIITARTHNGKTATCAVTVVKAPTMLSIALDELEMGKGEKFDLPITAKDADGNAYDGQVLYKASTDAVKVDSNGRVTALKAGAATVTAYTYNGLSDTIDITVKAAPTGISLNRTSGTLEVGDTYQLIYTLKGSNPGGSVTFASDKPGVCTVDAIGNVTGVAVGTATITVKTYNGFKATCKVTVKAAE